MPTEITEYSADQVSIIKVNLKTVLQLGCHLDGVQSLEVENKEDIIIGVIKYLFSGDREVFTQESTRSDIEPEEQSLKELRELLINNSGHLLGGNNRPESRDLLALSKSGRAAILSDVIAEIFETTIPSDEEERLNPENNIIGLTIKRSLGDLISGMQDTSAPINTTSPIDRVAELGRSIIEHLRHEIRSNPVSLATAPIISGGLVGWLYDGDHEIEPENSRSAATAAVIVAGGLSVAQANRLRRNYEEICRIYNNNDMPPISTLSIIPLTIGMMVISGYLEATTNPNNNAENSLTPFNVAGAAIIGAALSNPVSQITTPALQNIEAILGTLSNIAYNLPERAQRARDFFNGQIAAITRTGANVGVANNPVDIEMQVQQPLPETSPQSGGTGRIVSSILGVSNRTTQTSVME